MKSIVRSAVVTLICLLFAACDPREETVVVSEREPIRALGQSRLPGVKAAFAQAFPGVKIEGKEEVPLSDLDARIDELAVAEFLLKIESQLGTSVSHERLVREFGPSADAEIGKHLTLQRLSELVAVPPEGVRNAGD